MRSGQAFAALQGRNYVLPDDIKFLAVPVLAHRLILKEEERLRGTSQEDVVNQILNQVSVPVTET
jgi:MoxR-like ATPase